MLLLAALSRPADPAIIGGADAMTAIAVSSPVNARLIETIAGIAALLGRVQSAGLPSVTAGYSAVLLRNGAGLYILVGITAFAVGAALTLICIRLQNKRSPRTNRAKESEE